MWRYKEYISGLVDITIYYVDMQDNLGEVVDPVDLQVRFRDVEFEAPSITYESLKEGGHPIDIASVQQRINQYKSVVRVITV